MVAGSTWNGRQLGAGLATLAVETVGTQQYTFEPVAFFARLADVYGATASTEIESALFAAPALVTTAQGES